MFKSAQTFFLLLMITSAAAQTVADKLDTYLSNTNRKNKFNGTALVAVNGQVVLHKGYGLKNVAEKTNNDTATIFMIGSITKTFTAGIVLNLYGNNALNIEDKLSAYIPDYPNGNDITIEHLLTHTAGIFDYLQSDTYAKEDFSKPISIDRLISFFKLKPPLFKPGSKFSYSNSNYILLAFIIEKVTGKKYEDVVKEKIFAPLQMTHSGFDFKNLADTNKAINYDNIYKRKLVTNQVFDSTHAPGCGAIYATAGDLYKWDRALYSSNFIKDTILQKAYTPYKSKYGYGWFVDNSYGNLNVFHGGGVPGFHSHIQRFVNDDVCIILLSNNAYCDLSETTNRLASIIFDKPYEELTF